MCEEERESIRRECAVEANKKLRKLSESNCLNIKVQVVESKDFEVAKNVTGLFSPKKYIKAKAY